MLERLVEQNVPSRKSPVTRLPLKFAIGGMLGFEFLRQFHFLAERAAGPATWTPPEDHATIVGLQPDYDLLNALDERVSFYRGSYEHTVEPEDFQQYAAVRARWSYESVIDLCERMKMQVDAGFANLLT
jgi:hypothetical protein